MLVVHAAGNAVGLGYAKYLLTQTVETTMLANTIEVKHHAFVSDANASAAANTSNIKGLIDFVEALG